MDVTRKENMKPREKKKYIFAYVSEDLHQEVREYCVKNKISLVKLINQLLSKKVKK